MAGRTCFCILFSALFLPEMEARDSSLPWGDLNLVIVTDVHSWVSGRKHQPYYNADYGDLWSFYYHVKQESDKKEKDVFLINDGDIVEGTGMSDATTPDGLKLTPIIQKLPFDVMTTGNHELYHDSSIANILRHGGLAEHFRGKYITSNVGYKSTGKPLTRTHTHIKGKFTNNTYAAFGFLYNMKNHCPMVTVRTVEDTIVQPWFKEALEDTKGAVFVCHMGYTDKLVKKILLKTRELKGDKYPIVFVNGHTHIRAYKKLDKYAVTFEAGHYFDTIGFLSLSIGDADPIFKRRNITTNRDILSNTLGFSNYSDFQTEKGRQIRTQILQVRRDLELDKVLGCSPMTLSNRNQSSWKFYNDIVIPLMLNESTNDTISIVSIGGWRYELYAGEVTKDDVITFSPFRNGFYYIPDIKGSDITKLRKSLKWYRSSSIEVIPSQSYRILVNSFDSTQISKILRTYDLSPEVIKHPTSLDTTTIWFQYTKDYWKCNGKNTAEKSNRDKTNKDALEPSIIALIVILVLFAVSFPAVCCYCASWMRPLGSYGPVSEESSYVLEAEMVMVPTQESNYELP